MSGRVLKTAPNPAHYVLSRLSIPSIRQKIAPDSELTHVTQNIDGLLTRALNETAAAYGLHKPPVDIIEMHGRLFDVVCTAHDCDFHEANYDSPICPALGGTETVMQSEVPEPIVRRADLPHCPACGQLCRPGVVWFGERPKRIEDVLALADDADLCVIVGTSALVCLHLGATLSYLITLYRSNRLRNLADVLSRMAVKLWSSTWNLAIIRTKQTSYFWDPARSVSGKFLESD